MTQPVPIRVNTGNFVSALFLSVGRDIRDLMRNPVAFVGGIGGLALTSLALWFGGEAMANAAGVDCKPYDDAVAQADGVLDEAAKKLADADSKIASAQGKIDDLDALIKEGGTIPEAIAQMQSDKTAAEKELAAAQAERPALAKQVDDLGAALEQVQKEHDDAGCKSEDEFEIDFTPGTIAKLGVKPEDLPEKLIIQETRAPDPDEVVPDKETVTKDEKQAPSEEPKDKPKEPSKEHSDVKDNKDKKLPTSKNPTHANTPYHDLPTYDKDIGNPFGDPEGWDDLNKDGDPWATSVMKALNNMPIGAYAAKAKQGEFKFQLTICKDGTIKEVRSKGGDLPEDGQAAVKLALEQLEIPKPPKKVADSMPSNCAKIKYTFVWSARGVK